MQGAFRGEELDKATKNEYSNISTYIKQTVEMFVGGPALKFDTTMRQRFAIVSVGCF